MCSLIARPYVTQEKDNHSFRVAQMPLFVRKPKIKSVKINLNIAPLPPFSLFVQKLRHHFWGPVRAFPKNT